ncbi:MAG: hypothetical protein WCT48_05170 [Candidatus Paceibacterota bacterium]
MNFKLSDFMEEYNKEIIDLVVARLQTLPEGVGVSIGSEGDYSKQELISHVEHRDAVGKKIIDAEMGFLRALKEGNFYGDLIGNLA